jgi:rhamnogalacturonyl hydrolase YesR
MLSRKITLLILVISALPVYISSAQYYLRVEYPIAPGFYFAEVNGVKIYDPSQTVYLNAGDGILVAVRDKALYISRRAADYVISKAEVEGDGFKWVYQSRYAYYNPIFENGAAGAGYFLLSLYKITGNNTYLRYAEGAARWIISEAEPRDGGFTWPHHDDEKPGPDGWYLTPEKSVAGVARFFLELYRTTSKDEYLRYAEGAARWIINAGLRKDVQGSYVDYNPYYQAVFGIYSYPQRDAGLLFIDLYRTTGNKEYLDKAKEIGKWIIWTSECTGSICKWYDDRGYGNVYSVEGVSSVADLLYELYLTTKDPEYLEVAEKMVNWIESIGVRTNEGIKFPSWDGKFRTITWGWWDRLLFPMTPADIFLKSYEITHKSERLDIAKAYANWLISISVPEGNGVKVPEVEGEGGFHAWINSRVFKFVVMLYNLTGDGRYLDFSEKLLNWISSKAVCENGYVWPTSDGRKIPTFSSGSSGIGYYTLAPLMLVGPAKVLDGQITGVSPSSVSMRPGESTSFVFTVKNTGNILADYHVYFPDGSIFGYVSGTISLNPGEYGEITLTGRAPSGTSPGTYAVDVYFEMAPHGGMWQRTTVWGRIQVNILSVGVPPIFTLSESQVSGLTVTVNGVANPGYEGASITRVHWDWGDGSKEDQWFPATHTYSSAGTYTITVTAYQSDGLSTTKTLSVKVGAENKPPTAYIDSIFPNPAYEDQTISFSGHGYDPDGEITECDWRADGRVLSSSCFFSISLPPGKYTIYFRVKDDKGAWSTWVTEALEVKQVATAPDFQWALSLIATVLSIIAGVIEVTRKLKKARS